MSTNSRGAGGEFVIADMSFRDDIAAPVRWSSSSVPAVAPVEVTISAGVTVTVDIGNPSAVIAFGIEDFGDPEALLATCEPGDSVEALVRGVVGGRPPTEVVELTLRPEWARVALVAGISRWLPTPLHEGALLLDQAAAFQAVGQSVAAARYVALGAPVLEALATDAGNGILSTAVSAELTEVARLAADAVDGLDWGSEIRGFADQIASDAGLSDIDLDLVLLAIRHEAGELATSASKDFAPDTVIDVLADPAANVARIIKWINGTHRDIHVVVTPEGEDDFAELRVELSEVVDECSYEVGRVTAFVADLVTGELLRTGTTEARNGILRAELKYHRPDSGQVAYGVFDADKGVRAIRVGVDAPTTIAIDRIMLDAWATYREALVTQARIGGEVATPTSDVRQRVETLLARAQHLVSSARGQLSRLRRRISPTNSDMADHLAARSVAIEAFESQLRGAGTIPQPGASPLLAELLPLVTEVE